MHYLSRFLISPNPCCWIRLRRPKIWVPHHVCKHFLFTQPKAAFLHLLLASYLKFIWLLQNLLWYGIMVKSQSLKVVVISSCAHLSFFCPLSFHLSILTISHLIQLKLWNRFLSAVIILVRWLIVEHNTFYWWNRLHRLNRLKIELPLIKGIWEGSIWR